MARIREGTREKCVSNEDAEALHRAGIVRPCECHVMCGGPQDVYHLDPDADWFLLLYTLQTMEGCEG